jgi:hypothetical protein
MSRLPVEYQQLEDIKIAFSTNKAAGPICSCARQLGKQAYLRKVPDAVLTDFHTPMPSTAAGTDKSLCSDAVLTIETAWQTT